MPIIEMHGVKRFYVMGDITVKALRTIDLSIEQGEFVAVMGPSGSGKSTLMNIIGCLDKPTDGVYILDGLNTKEAKMDDFADIRNQKIGFVFQGFNLLSRTTAVENVELPLFYNRKKRISDSLKRAEAALKKVGLGTRLDHVPSQLSGGQQQRVAIARALVNDPAFILADEPTGNLDTETTIEIMALFQELNDQGITIVMVTHEPDMACYVKRIITMQDGLVVSDRQVDDRKKASEDLQAWRVSHSQLYKEQAEALP
jgi:putative ABC transport system ATP-binding protein